MSEAVMMALIRKGMNRQEAHELLRKLAMKSEVERRHFKEVLLEDKVISSKLSVKEIDEALNPANYLGTALEQVNHMVKNEKPAASNIPLAPFVSKRFSFQVSPKFPS